MDFGAKQYAIQRRVMKLRAKEGISLKKAWARVKAAMKQKKKSPKKKPAKKTKKSKRDKGPSLGQLQGFASDANISFTKKLVGGGYGKSPLTKTALKYRLTKNGVDWRNASPGSNFLSPILNVADYVSSSTSDFLSPVFANTSDYSLPTTPAAQLYQAGRTNGNVPLSQQSSNFGRGRY